MSVFSERLQDFYKNKQSEISERDILRISGILGGKNSKDPFEKAKSEILKWVKNRAGQLPKEAEEFEDFSIDIAGRNVECRAEDFGDVKVWGLRAEDPDKNVAGRIWKTEIIILKRFDGVPRLSLRLRVTNKGHDDQFIPSTPGIIQQIIEKVGLKRNGDIKSFTSDSNFIDSDASFEDFLEYLESEKRTIPIILLSQIPSQSYYSIKPKDLAQRLHGLSQIYCISDEYSWKLSSRINKQNSVFDGGIKVYYPSVNLNSDRLDLSTQKLLTRNYIQEVKNPNTPIRLIVSGICEHSLSNQRLGRDIYAFSEFSSKLRKHRADKIVQQSGNSFEENTIIQALKEQIESLEKEVREKEEMEVLALDDNDILKQRAEEAERQKNNLRSRLQVLENANLSNRATEEIQKPKQWDEFIEWVEKQFPDKIVLTPNARRGIKKAQFEDINKVVISIEWLATRGIKARISSNGESLRDENITEGVLHAHCGGDAYDFDASGNTFCADWHVKTGGNTRDPKRCLRIYYAWDEQNQQIIISDMPAHIKTDAS